MGLTQINFRCDIDNKIFLIKYAEENGGYGLLLRNLITEYRLKIGDPIAVKNKIQEYQDKIKQLELIKNQNSIDNKKIQDILEYHSFNYKQNATVRSERQRFNFLEKTVLSQIKPLGYKGSLKELDDLLINWPTEEGNEI